ncbi:MAG: WD40 repeat domain-containing protein, partial [Cyanobacteria bacterium P01_D01_bin.56]
ALRIPLNGITLSNAVIYHADLRDHRFKNVTFKNCQFIHTALPIKVHGELAIALSPKGTTLAVGDGLGRVFCWRLENDVFQLKHFTRLQPENPNLPSGITHLAFGDERTLSFATKQEVYSWWLSSENGFSNAKPMLAIDELPAPVSCLAAQGEDRIAAGLETGDIVLWNEFRGSVVITAHQTPIRTLVLSADGSRLLSIGYGDRLIEWDITSAPVSQERRSDGELFVAGSFHEACSVIADANNDDGSLGIRLADGARRTIPFRGNGDLMRLSRNGQYVAVVVDENVRVLVVSNLSSYDTIPIDYMPTNLIVSNDGKWLLTSGSLNSMTHLVLWNVKTGQPWWELQSSEDAVDIVTPPTDAGLSFQQCEVNDSAAEQAYFIDYYGPEFAS